MDFAPVSDSDVDAWCRAAMATPPLAPEDEKLLARRIEDGDSEARDWLARAHLRLVIEAARRHASEGASLLPLLQSGTDALLGAIEAFDPTSGERFAEQARPFIELAMDD